ncbi:MAG: carbohydrate binding family 9 domain-containing protein [bacterium]|nr:carbohydrate binding family 9 domain-containing protein [bacterium]
MRLSYVVLACALAAATPVLAEGEKKVPARVYESSRVADEPPTLDGRLDDPVWDAVDWSGDFIQREPAEGLEPSQQTEFKVVYDDEAVYFAFRLHDDPQQVSRQLARRDRFPGDWVEVNIDSYFDRRTAFSFTLSASGTQGDELISNDGNRWDSNWDPVWNGAAQVDSGGWTAEMRIPLSQLRFSAAEEQTWGLQITRRVYRLEERSSWQRIPKDVSGWVSNFGELRGLRNLSPKRRIELLPYAVASSESFEAEPGNPFRDGSESDIDGGIDGKIGVTNNLTIDFTINPDFGQVEADPSQLNLTAFEVFFDEKRPFFIEGNDIFELRLAPAVTGGPFTRDRLFYSRRIGRPPGFEPDAPDGGFVDQPGNSTIIGAFKLSGKTASGLSIGVLESVTAEETAAIDDGGERSSQVVEPLTSYFVGRLRQDYRDGDTQIGGMVTAVNRQIDDEQIRDQMRSDAYAGGIDLSHYFHKRDYRFEASLFASEINGSQEAILGAQESSARYYQRPDNDYVTLDPTRTSLSGHSGSARLTRTSNHELVFQTGFAWRSPGFEINDLGFMRAADGINQFTWVAYQKRNPFSIFDRLNVNGNQRLDWDYGGNFLTATFNVNANAQFKNKYGAGFGITRDGELTSNTRLRGGPSSRWPGRWSARAWVDTDRRKKLAFSLGTFARKGDDGSDDTEEAWGAVIWRPNDAMRLSLNPSFTRSEREMQYIGTEAFGDDDRFLFGSIDQETTVLNLRLDYSITPDLTVQLYASPFVSTGRYSAFKRTTDPRASSYRDRFDLFDADQISFEAEDDLFEVDEDRDGVVDYSFDDPDFDFREFNSNLVIRWEYRPGSAIFLVWSQVRDDSTLLADDLGFGSQVDQLFAVPSEDVVLIKVSKWFSP